MAEEGGAWHRAGLRDGWEAAWHWHGSAGLGPRPAPKRPCGCGRGGHLPPGDLCPTSQTGPASPRGQAPQIKAQPAEGGAGRGPGLITSHCHRGQGADPISRQPGGPAAGSPAAPLLRPAPAPPNLAPCEGQGRAPPRPGCSLWPQSPRGPWASRNLVSWRERPSPALLPRGGPRPATALGRGDGGLSGGRVASRDTWGHPSSLLPASGSGTET